MTPPVNMMSTFRDILSDFESATRSSDVELYDLAAEDAHVLEKPDVNDGVDGLSRWCGGCDEYWPLEAKFFSRTYHMTKGFNARCKACVVESKALSGSKLRIPANIAGPLTIYFPEAPTKSCTGCQRVYPYLGLFWHQDASGALSDVCASCKPITQSPCQSIEAMSHAA